MTLKRIHREIADLKKEDLGAITLAPAGDNLFLFKGTIPGPEGSVYEGGVYNLDVQLAPDYPYVLAPCLGGLGAESGLHIDFLRRKSCLRRGECLMRLISMLDDLNTPECRIYHMNVGCSSLPPSFHTIDVPNRYPRLEASVSTF